MAYEKRIKGTTRWRATSEKEAFELVGFLRLGDLAAGATVETPYAYVRLRSDQQVLPGIGEEKPGAYGRSRPVVDEHTRFVEDPGEG